MSLQRRIINERLTLFVFLVLLAGICSGSVAGLESEGNIEGAPKGLYAFGWARHFQNTPALEYPYIDGFTAYSGWDLLEPQDGIFEWATFDNILEKARKNGKIVNFGVYPGSHSPHWLYEKYGVSSFRWTRKLKEEAAERYGENFQDKITPLPWDRVYIKRWQTFLKALADRYGNDPAVGYIALTGPTIEGLDMANPLDNSEEISRFRREGFSDEKMVDAWIQMIDYYGEILPHKKWALAVGSFLTGDKNPYPAFEIVDYGLRKYPNNLIVMAVWLNDSWFNKGASRVTVDLIRQSGIYTYTGFQMAQSAQRNAWWKKQKPIVKSLRQSFENGLEVGISYLEVWHNADIVLPKTNSPNVNYIEDLKYIHNKLAEKKEPSFVPYKGQLLRSKKIYRK